VAPSHDPPVRFGRYELSSLIARGGMAEIYLGSQTVEGGLTRKVVIKKILPHLGSDPQFVAMFLDEARIAMLLQHPNIAHTIDFGKDGDDHYIVLEYVDGVSLRELVKRSGGRLPIGVALRIAAGVAAALAHAHAMTDDRGQRLGIVHRDVSPHNVLVARDGTVKLIDFGIAKAKSQVHDTEAGSMKGKFAYMAPEQFQGGAIDGRTDLFSISVVLWEAIAGQRLFRADSAAETMRMICSGARPSLRTIRPEVSAELEALIARGLEPRPEDRWPHAETLGLALEDLLSAAALPSSSLHVGQFVRSSEVDPTPIEAAPTAITPDLALHAEPTLLEPPPTGSATPMSVERSARVARPPRARRPALAAVAAGVVAGLVAAGAMLALREPAPVPQGIRATPIASGITSALPPLRPGPAQVAPPPTAPPRVAVPPSPPEVAAPSASSPPTHAQPRPEAAEARRAGEPRARPSPAVAPGRLFVNTRPWSKVYLRGRLLGTTPLGNIEVPSGPQRFTFELEDATRIVRTVEVRPDGPTKAFLELRE
jgi:serine/threonine-protein kinase